MSNQASGASKTSRAFYPSRCPFAYVAALSLARAFNASSKAYGT